MKVTGNQRTSGAATVKRASSARASSASTAASAVSGTQDTVSIAGIPKAELTPRVVQALTELMEEVSTLRLELAETKSRMNELATMAFTDPLTEVFNRRAFVTELNRTVALVNRHDQPASLAFFDMDDMKSINDAYGHAGGDLAVKHVATVIKANIRETDIIGRLGGDEFGVIFNYANHEDANEKVGSLQSQVASAPLKIGEQSFNVTVTAGVAPIKQGASAEAALDLADAAMYDGKKNKPAAAKSASKG